MHDADIAVIDLPQLVGLLCCKRATCLIDSGASGNFCSLEFARRHHLPVRVRSRRRTITLADGSQQSSRLFIPDAQLQLGDRCEQVNFTVMSLASHNFDVVLGMPWLTHANPSIDWARRTLTLPPSQHHEPATILRLMKCKELKRAVRDQTLEVIMVLRCIQNQDGTELVQGTEQEKADAETRRVLAEYADVFPAELPKRLPPDRDVDSN